MDRKDFIDEFSSLIDWKFVPTEDFNRDFDTFLTNLSGKEVESRDKREDGFIAKINAKIRLNASPIRDFLGHAAKEKVVFNYHEKQMISRAFDCQDESILESLLEKRSTASLGADVVDSISLGPLFSDCRSGPHRRPTTASAARNQKVPR